MTLTARLRHRVTVQRRVDSTNVSAGVVTYVWQNLHVDVPAEVLTGPGREAYAAGGKFAEADARITMRYVPDLRPEDRVVWRGVAYDIVSIETDATAARDYRLRCKASANNGV